jgi:hypothetical protein
VKRVEVSETAWVEIIAEPRVLHMDLQATAAGAEPTQVRFLLSCIVASVGGLGGDWRALGLPEGYKWGDAWIEDPETLVSRRLHLLRHLSLATMRKLTGPCMEAWQGWAEQPSEEQSKNSDGPSDN